MQKGENFPLNSVTLDKSKCMGCTTCMKHCPTEAIRVRNGRAHILAERCIDCGNCIRYCPHKAKKAETDPFDSINAFKYTVALPAPSLYGQFHNLDDVNIVLAALKKIGFDDVYEVSRAAEQISDVTRKRMARGGLPRPYISSACPAVVRLIRLRFPELIPNIAEQVQPVELAAMTARANAVEKTGLKAEDIGVFFITPCAAKVTTAHESDGVIDGAISMNDVYKRLLPAMRTVESDYEQLSSSGIVGIGWSRSGGEAAALLDEGHLAVDGIDNIIKILEDVEDGMLPEVNFLELNACTQGCVGGCLAVENAYVAKTRINHLMRYLPVSRNRADEETEKLAISDRSHERLDVWQLDDDRAVAMEKYQRIEKLTKELPGLDCGSCGAPSCRALAEDVVLGFASEEDCIFHIHEKMQYLTGAKDAEAFLPPPFRKEGDKGRKETL